MVACAPPPYNTQTTTESTELPKCETRRAVWGCHYDTGFIASAGLLMVGRLSWVAYGDSLVVECLWSVACGQLLLCFACKVYLQMSNSPCRHANTASSASAHSSQAFAISSISALVASPILIAFCPPGPVRKRFAHDVAARSVSLLSC